MSGTRAKATEAVAIVNEAADQATATVSKSFEQSAAAASKSVEQAAATTAKAMEHTVSTVKDNMTAAAAGIERSQAQVKEVVDKVFKTTEEMVAFGQGNFEALMKSSQILSAGVQDLSKQVAANAQSSMDEGLSAFKALSGIKSLKEAVDVQSSLARASIEKAISESSRFTDASLKLAEQAFAPLSARVTLAVQKFAKPL
jgi:phasin family protein